MRLSKDALRNRLCFSLAFVVLLQSANIALAATYTTPNFLVTAPTAEIAEKCGKTAEFYREAIAMEWLGKKMPRWYKPCTLSVKVGQIGAGGATTFAFDRGEVFGWRMNVQGSLERILDSVIPHEVSHTVFACHSRRPLPRWADEGAATLIEHESERHRQALLLKQVWNTQRRIPLRKLLSIKEYPSEMQNVLTLYAEGYSLADFLVQAGGKTRYLEFLETAHEQGWDRAIEQHYSLKDVEELENRWNNWVMAGSPQINIPKGTQVASNTTATTTSAPNSPSEFERPLIRAQSPEQEQSAAEQPVASAPQVVADASSPTVPLPKTEEIREESPGWRRMREQLKEIPADFVNPAKEPTQPAREVAVKSASASFPSSETAELNPTAEVTRLQNNPVAMPPNVSRTSSPPSNEPAFRFELEEPSGTPGGQNPGSGRSPNWSDFPRNQTSRGPAALENASERPFSP